MDAARKLFFEPEALASNIRYLQYDATSFQINEGGRTWKVYGSPVSIRPSLFPSEECAIG